MKKMNGCAKKMKIFIMCSCLQKKKVGYITFSKDLKLSSKKKNWKSKAENMSRRYDIEDSNKDSLEIDKAMSENEQYSSGSKASEKLTTF